MPCSGRLREYECNQGEFQLQDKWYKLMHYAHGQGAGGKRPGPCEYHSCSLYAWEAAKRRLRRLRQGHGAKVIVRRDCYQSKACVPNAWKGQNSKCQGANWEYGDPNGTSNQEKGKQKRQRGDWWPQTSGHQQGFEEDLEISSFPIHWPQLIWVQSWSFCKSLINNYYFCTYFPISSREAPSGKGLFL